MNIFEPFPKIPRFSKAGGCCITEKIDGTNAQIYITERPSSFVEEETTRERYTANVDNYFIYCGSRQRLVTPDDDNYGFAQWVFNNAEELSKLGPGRHYGEWWGCGIQRNYGVLDKRFSLFNVNRWNKVAKEDMPNCVYAVPALKYCPFEVSTIKQTLADLRVTGSIASPGYMNPEGIVIYQFCTDQLFKMTYDDNHKGAISDCDNGE